VDKIAIISDVHGNITALEAVLKDIKTRGIEKIYNLGDLVGKGPNSAKSIELCRETCDKVVLGNWDDFLFKEKENPSILWHQAQLNAAQRVYLESLPHTIDFVMSGRQVRLYHASHTSVHKRYHPTKPMEELESMFTNTDFTGHDNPEPDVVGYGDIHAAYLLPIYTIRKTLFNTGSVGNPLDHPTASYAVISGVLNGNTGDPFGIEFIRTPYDVEAEIALAEKMEMPDLAPYARELRTAEYRGKGS
jgi:protein phosphatase